MREVVATAIADAQSRQAAEHNEGRRQRELTPGELVLVHYPNPQLGLADKLLSKNKGPYEIIKKLSPTTYRLKSLKPPHKEQVVNVQRIIPYILRSINEEETEDNDNPDLPETMLEPPITMHPVDRIVEIEQPGEQESQANQKNDEINEEEEHSNDVTDQPRELRRSNRINKGTPPDMYGFGRI